MKILFAASEAAPFIKTGGLADVAGSLPPALAAAGHDVRVIVPLYSDIPQEWREQMTFVTCSYVQLGWRRVYLGLMKLERDGVVWYFADNEHYFRREGVYGHFDDGERFAFFSRAVVSAPGMLDWAPDILHCNDWQTALAVIYLLEERHRCPQLAGTHSVFTIHNIEYQGRYGRELLGDLFGLNDGYFNEDMLAFHGDINLIKGAINAADFVTTVSPTYAEELSYAFYAHGLEGVINHNRHKMRGILNGIDMELYNPASTPGLTARYTSRSLDKKAENKAALQWAVGLREEPEVPIIACVSRLVGHKGFWLVTQVFRQLMEQEVQFAVLGTGEWHYEEFFRNAQRQYPGRVAASIKYSASLSTAMYAGADLLLMPSISEPCGLSQMIAMRYGTIPIVRETGGLKDTVTPYIARTGEGRGFTFANIDPEDMLHVICQALNVYKDKKTWRKLMRRDMTADFSWNRSAGEYVEIYNQIS